MPIAHRLATQVNLYGEIVEQRTQKDPTVVTLSMQNQFRELLERPLQVLGESHHLTAIEGRVIVIDGLDEYNGTDGGGNAGETHRDVNFVATSVHAQGTPFRWMILSRSEPSIVAAFKDAQVLSITIHEPLRISREIDNEIEHIIKDFTRIGKESGLLSSWFSEKDVETLVDLCAGLWAYEATIVRFIAMWNSSGPASQLRIFLDFAARQRATGDNPLAALDAFYTLIVNSVPTKTFLIAQRIIILAADDINQVLYLSYILGISEAEIEYARATLHAVLDIRIARRKVTFHHASFTDYIKDRERSGDLCVSGQVEKAFWQDTMKRMLEVVCARQKGEWIDNAPSFRIVIKHIFVAVITVVCSSDWRTDEAVIAPHRNYDFNTVLRTFINSRASESSTLAFASLRDSPNTYSLSVIDEFFKALKDLLRPLLRPCYNPFIHLNSLKLLKLINEDPNVSDETISDSSSKAGPLHFRTRKDKSSLVGLR
ncbi:hypothetical protein D9756_009175 [Leucocoprinus leucothites]|uniref:NACHT domain-containing protein n=1 Tax=Leucocoprinus leucothites TaxID=201217 RepID=A0A8H5CY33_9AGAR|nr:hypothetical protein D9756_009175 [Leucoagaricus leucothites]